MPKPDYRKLILGYLFSARTGTRTQIADSLGIRKSTVGQVCAELLSEGKILSEAGVKRNERLRIDSGAFLALGIEHKVACLKMVALDSSLARIAWKSVPMGEVFEEARVQSIIADIKEFIEENSLKRESIVGLGFSDFIPHDIGTGLKSQSIWMPGWGSINIKAKVEESLKLDSQIMRCTDAFSLAESAFGSCTNVDTFITVQLDEGIGLSVFRSGSYLKGSTDIFGELGHTVYREDGEICKCGNRGCLETIAGVEAVVKKVKDNVEKGTYFRFGGRKEDISLGEVMANASEANKLALLALNEAAKAIGNTLAVVVNVLGITRVILYGSLVSAGELLWQQVLNSIRQHCIYPLNQDTEVTLSALDEYACAAGAAYAILRSHFKGS